MWKGVRQRGLERRVRANWDDAKSFFCRSSGTVRVYPSIIDYYKPSRIFLVKHISVSADFSEFSLLAFGWLSVGCTCTRLASFMSQDAERGQ